MSLSLDEIGKKHDEIRRNKGLFKKVLRTLKLLKKLQKEYPNLFLNVVSVFSSFNKDRMSQIHNFVENKLRTTHAVCLIRGSVLDPTLKENIIDAYEEYVHNTKFRNDMQNLIPLFAKIRFFVESFMPVIIGETVRKNKMILPCYAGKKTIVLYDNGDVAPCEPLGKRFGNVRKSNYKIYSLINSRQGKNILKSIRNTKCYCTWECIIPVNLVFNPTVALQIIVVSFLRKLKPINKKTS